MIDMKNNLRVFKSELGMTYMCFINKREDGTKIPTGYVNGNPFDEQSPTCDFYLVCNTNKYNVAKDNKNLPIFERWDTCDTPWSLSGGMLQEADDFDVETFLINLTYLSMMTKRFFYVKDGELKEKFISYSKAKRNGFL